LRKALLSNAEDMRTDGQLLGAFLTHRDEAAFATLVRRHGSMVFGVCRRVIGDAHESEDAFQATFVVLARKAASIKPRELVGHWLYGVAYRTALEAKAICARRTARERQVINMPHPFVQSDESRAEWRWAIDEELNRLPAKLRAPVVLCELEGRSRKEVARQLGIPEGTLSSRLAAARKRLARGLSRRGVTLSAGAVAALTADSAPACIPPALMVATVEATLLPVPSAAVSAKVALLAEAAVKALLWTKLKAMSAILAVISVISIGVVGTAVVFPGQSNSTSLRSAVPLVSAPANKVEPKPAAVFADAVAAAKAIEREDYWVIAMERIAYLQEKTGDLDAARATLRAIYEMIQGRPAKGMEPNWLRNLATAQARIGDVAGARQSTDALMTSGFRHEELSNDALAALAVAEAAANELPRGFNTVEKITKASNRNSTLKDIAVRRAQQKDFTGAANAIAKIDEDCDRAHAMAEVAKLRFQNGDKERGRNDLLAARQLASSSKPTDAKAKLTKSWALTHIIGLLTEIGELKAARQSADSVEDEWRNSALHAIAWAQAQRDDIEGALSTVALLPKDQVYLQPAIAQAQIRKGDLPAALKTAQSIKHSYRRAETFLEIARAHAKAGDRNAMAQAIESATTAAEGYADSERIVGGMTGILRFIAECQVQLDDIEGATSTLTKLRNTKEAQAGVGEYEMNLSYALRAVGWGLARKGKAKEALNLATLTQHDFYRVEVYKEIACGQTEAGGMQAALAWIEKLNDPFSKAFALAGVAEGLAQRGQKAKQQEKKR
jgi:RNA polymerase sigma factor (sigma-70 family)